MATKKKKEKREPQLSVIKHIQPDKEEHARLKVMKELERQFLGKQKRIPIVGGYILTTRPENFKRK